jgi:hypothetical protein
MRRDSQEMRRSEFQGLEEEIRLIEAEKNSIEAEKRRIEEKRKSERMIEEERRKVEEEKNKIELEKKRLEEEKNKIELEKKKIEEERKRLLALNLGKSMIDEIKSVDVKTFSKCWDFLMSDTCSKFLSLFPVNDDTNEDDSLIQALMYFFLDFSLKIFPAGLVDATSKERDRLVNERLKQIDMHSNIERLFNNYKRQANRLHFAVLIGMFHEYHDRLSARMWIILDVMEEFIKKCADKQKLPTKDCVYVLRSLSHICVRDDLKKYGVSIGILSSLIRILSLDDFILVQYALAPFYNISCFCSDEVWKILVDYDIWKVLNSVLTKLTFTSSTLPSPHYALYVSFEFISTILEKYPLSVELLIDSPLISLIVEVLQDGMMYFVSNPLSKYGELIFLKIYGILVFCSKLETGRIKLRQTNSLLMVNRASYFFNGQLKKGRLEFGDLASVFENSKL